MRRTPYSPLVENETAPEPWKSGRWVEPVVGLIVDRCGVLATLEGTISE
jgi:hypothetical protein